MNISPTIFNNSSNYSMKPAIKTVAFSGKKEDGSKIHQDESKLKSAGKWILGAAGVIGAGVIGYLGFRKSKPNAGEIIKGAEKDTDKLVQEASENFVGRIMGEGIKRDPAESMKRAQRNYEQWQRFPELNVHSKEYATIFRRNQGKKKEGLRDLDFYKDEFRAHVTLMADNIKTLREAENPELKALFNSHRVNFSIHNGIMIHGSDRQEKKELFEHFISEAQKHGIDIVHIPAGETDPHKTSQEIYKEFKKAKEKFQTEKKYTMIVFDGDVDKMLGVNDETAAGFNASCRGMWNTNTNKCGDDGVITLSTAKNLANLDSSCTDGGGGRITHRIDIDKAVELSKKAQG